MKLTAVRRIVAAVVLICVSTFGAGCILQVDLEATPDSVGVGQQVQFDVKVTNSSQCPVETAIVLIFPFIPKNAFIDELELPDEDLENLTAAVDALCTDGDFEVPDGGMGSCRIEDGALICSISDRSMGNLPSESGESFALATTAGGDQVTCKTDGWTLTCRIPESVIEMGTQMASSATGGGASTVGSLLCGEIDGFAACIAPFLAPAQMAVGQLFLSPPVAGVLRTFALAFPVRGGGMCKGGIIPRACRNDSDCTSNDCGSGICTGDNAGFGCDDSGECPNGACTQCVSTAGEVQAGLACTQTIADPVTAPAMSPWGLLAAVLGLAGVGAFGLRRLRRGDRSGSL